MKTFVCLGLLAWAATSRGNEFHVALNGNDAHAGTRETPFRTIQHAAEMAQPDDVVTVHAGVYRERIDPPRGGSSGDHRITYQAAPGEKVVVTGAEPMRGWVKVTNDTWMVTLPNAYFGKFNPYADRIRGDWCSNPLRRHTGAVYLNGDWLTETARSAQVLAPADATPLWFANVGGVVESGPEYLLNVAFFRAGSTTVPVERIAARSGTQFAPCSEGGQCLGYIRDGNWVRYDGVDFGSGTRSVEFRAAAAADTGGEIELHLDSPRGDLLGVCEVSATGDWQRWQTFTAKIKSTSGRQNLCLVFKPAPAPKIGAVERDKTVIYAQFPGLNPNESDVEINVRQTVFTPSHTGIDFLTVRGFELRAAATPWAPPTAGQIGIISAYWCKGWIIEHNRICYSPCCGIALGKYADEFDNSSADTAEGYVGTLTRALTNGWNRATVGSHIVRDNEISHCEQTGIVGSLGCSFSTVTRNEVHDIHIRNLYGGAEMAGIKIHGAIDVQIQHNHIYRTCLGLWLDWMAQGCRVSGNLLHDNQQDIFFEMQHGPILVDNNLLLSPAGTISLNSQGVAFAHNLIAGPVSSGRGDDRTTPFHLAHTTALGGLWPAPKGDSGDHRFYNNLFAGSCDLRAMDNSALPCFAAGNVFTRGTQASKFDSDSLMSPDYHCGVTLVQRADGWYLALAEAPMWRDEARRQLITTELLGKAEVSACAYENPDGSPVSLNADYFGNRRDEANPFPGPFEKISPGLHQIKVWPWPANAP